MTAIIQSIAGYANVAADLPAGVVAGDLLVIFGTTYNGDTVTLSVAQPGWSTLRGPDRQTGTDSTINYIFWKIAGASEPTQFYFNISGASFNYYDIAIARITNFDSVQPFQVDSYATNGFSATRSGVSFTVDQDDTLVLGFSSGFNYGPSSTPGGLTQLVLYDSVNAIYSAGSKNTGIYSFPDIPQAGSDSYVNQFIGIRPVQSATPKIKRQAVFF